MKVAALQMVSTPEVAANLARARALGERAAAAEAELLVLPEYFCLMGRQDTDKLAHAETFGAGPIQDALAAMASELHVWLVGGTLPLRGAERSAPVFNASLMFDPQGHCTARYDKMHLFRFDDGERRYDEAATLQAGAAVQAVDLQARDGSAWRMGLSICYDLRFPELYRALMQPACDLFVVPSAFTVPTGQAHWELLLRARAVENQCYVLAAAQGGRHANGRRTYGHSMVVDPWGEVLAMQAQDEAVVLAELRRARLQEVRTALPALSHRIPGL